MKGGDKDADRSDDNDTRAVHSGEGSDEQNTRESSVPPDNGNVTVLDTDEHQRYSSLTSIITNPSTSSPSDVASSVASPPSTAHLDTDDTLWPGDIHQSCARLFCPHNKLDPRLHKQRLTKRISSVAWSRLIKANVDQHITRPNNTFCNRSLCGECVEQLQRESDQLSAQRAQYEGLVEAMREVTEHSARSQTALENSNLSDSEMLLDRNWYNQFAAQVKRSRDKPYTSAAPLTSNVDDINKGLICEHGTVRVRLDHPPFLISAVLSTRFVDLYPLSTTPDARADACQTCTAADKSDTERRELLARH